MLENIKFNPNLKLKKKEYLKNISELIDNRYYSYEKINEFFSVVESEISNILIVEDTSLFLDAYIKFISSFNEFVKNMVENKRQVISYTQIYDVLYSNFLSINLEISFNDKEMALLSMGERANVLLKILLCQGDNPILIDQPEEHLDNRFIFEDLTPAFREAKKHRQIIIATHNANLVVNTDAEKVIIATCQNGKISYKSGTLENVEIREEIKTILEGGETAFKKREERYGMIF